MAQAINEFQGYKLEISGLTETRRTGNGEEVELEVEKQLFCTVYRMSERGVGIMGMREERELCSVRRRQTRLPSGIQSATG